MRTLWLFTRSDLKTVVLPQTIFGLTVALSGGALTTNESPKYLDVLNRLPLLVLWIWLSLLSEVIANQRLPHSIVEDSINRPWRPIPSKRLRPDEARKLLLWIIPSIYITSLVLGGTNAFIALTIFSYMYNDLDGANESPLSRNVLNACGLSAFSVGAAEVATGNNAFNLRSRAYIWIAVLAAIITSTVQIQDLPDLEGDKARGRKTVPLVYGDGVTRWSLVVTILPWSIFCPFYWRLSIWGYILPCFIGAMMLLCVVFFRTRKADEALWKMWCIWIITLYSLPLFE
jgi:4-hydroxybenzoate polyprenyltransferase